MTDRFAERRPSDQLLGEIATEIIAGKRSVAAIQPGDKVYLEPGHASLGGPHAVIVENSDAELLGFLPKGLVRWLCPLLERGVARVEGYMPVQAPPSGDPNRRSIVLTVYQTERADFLSPIEPADELQALHELVRHAYFLAQRFPKPAMIRNLAPRLSELQKGPLLPETRLLLALLPGLVHELHACDSMRSIVEFRQELAALSIGEAVNFDGATFFPLLLAERSPLPFVMLDAAVAAGDATIDEIAPSAGQDGALVVINRSSLPLLVPEGEIVCGSFTKGVVSTTLLLAPGARHSLPLCAEAEWRLRRTYRHAADPSHHAECMPEAGRPGSKLSESAAGVAVVWGGRIIGIDLFATAAAFQAASRALVDAYLQRMRPNSLPATAPSADDVRRFIDRIAGAARPRNATSGIGLQMEIAANKLFGRAVLHGGRICHLTAFVPADKAEG